MQFGVIDDGGSETCDSSTCGWENQSCGGGSCSAGEMQQQYTCSDGNCDDGDTRCVSKSICNNSCISSETTFSDPSCTTHSGDHDQCDATLEKGWEGGVPAEGETGTWAREGCYSAGNEGEVGSCLSDGKVTNQRVRCDSNTDPTANNDSVSMKECTKSATIDVLKNDTDPDGDSPEIKSVENYPPNGIANVDNGKIVYTPDDNTDTSFSYTIKDGNGGEGTGQVDVSFSSCQGSISVQVEDQNGNPVNMDSIDITYEGDNCPSGSDTSQLTCSPELQDSGAVGTYSVSDPDYDVVDRKKYTDAPDNHQGDPTKTELGF